MKNVVENIIKENSSVVFVLESPHTAELYHKYPLAGDSGREISKYLLERYDIPFGLFLKNKRLQKLFNFSIKETVSIINVSKLALQEIAYSYNGIVPPRDIQKKEKLKRLLEQGGSFKTQHRDNKINNLKKCIYETFQKEFLQNFTSDITVIPCGRFAQTFCEELKAKVTTISIDLVESIPHPSNGWSSLEKEKIDNIKTLVLLNA